jgi:hypothetical protein
MIQPKTSVYALSLRLKEAEATLKEVQAYILDLRNNENSNPASMDLKREVAHDLRILISDLQRMVIKFNELHGRVVENDY